MNNLDKNYNQTFEDIKHIAENGVEFWYARELMKVLSYKDWRYFDAVVEKAKIACQNSELTNIDHFVVDNKMVEIGSGAKREQKDYKLTRYDGILAGSALILILIQYFGDKKIIE